MCNCKKNKYETKVIMGTPEPIPTPQVIKLPLDEIKTEQNGTGTTGETEQSQTGV